MLGVRLLTVPRDVTAAVGTPDGWISVFIGLMIAFIAGTVSGLLARLFPQKDYFEFVPQVIGRIPGYILATGYILYFSLFAAIELRIMGEVVRNYLLSRTPLELILLVMMLSALYLLYGGMRPLVQVQQLFFPIVILITAMLILMSFSVFDAKNLQPILGKGFVPVIKGVPQTSFSNLGFTTIMIFAAYMKNPQHAVRSVVTAIAIAGGINALIVFVAIGAIQYQTLDSLVFPIMEVVKTIEIPGGFLERLESIFITIFIMTIFSSVTIALFVSSHGIEKLYGIKGRKNLLFLIPFVTFIALALSNLQSTFALGDVVVKLGIFYVGTVPAMLFIIAKLRNLGTRIRNPSQQNMASEDEVQC